MSEPGWVWSTDPSEGWEGAAETRADALADAAMNLVGADLEEVSVAPVADTDIEEGERFVFTGKIETVPWPILFTVGGAAAPVQGGADSKEQA